MPLPSKYKDPNGKEAWLVRRTGEKVMLWENWVQQDKLGLGIRPKADLKNMNDIFKVWNDISFSIGGRAENSTEYVESDNVYYSTEVYCCSKIISSQKCVFCVDVVNDRYCVACSYAWNSTSVIRALDSRAPLSQSFALNWCGRISKSMYLSNCMDMYECLFCTNMRGKKYCIANMQFTKEEYEPIKQMVIDWTIDHFGPKRSILF